MKKLYFLSGPPRTGSKLLASILNQNPEFHLEQTSPLCRVLWSLNESFRSELTKNDFFAANRNEKSFKNIFYSVIKEYYRETNANFVFDKNTSWTIHANYEMIVDYIDSDPKIIVTMRNFEDIVKSYVNVYLKNNFSQQNAENILLNLDKNFKSPLLRSIAGVIWVQFTKNKNYLIIDYDNLINNPQKEILSIYEFLNLKPYKHDYNNINFLYPENENFILKGLMEVRNKIEKVNVNINLSDIALKEINKISKIIKSSYKKSLTENEIYDIIDFYETHTTY
jgi:sulfotransferase